MNGIARLLDCSSLRRSAIDSRDWSGLRHGSPVPFDLGARDHKLVNGGSLDFGAAPRSSAPRGGGYAAASESRADGQAVGF
jgi:hypothetical protein